MRPRALRRLLLPLAAVLLVTGCSGLPGGGPAPAGTPAGAQAAPDGVAPAAPPADGALSVLGTRSGTAPGAGTGGADATFEVEVNELRVVGKLAQLTFTVRNTTPRCCLQIGEHLGDGVFQSSSDPYDRQSADGVQLVDPAGDVRYLPGRIVDESEACVCATSLSGEGLRPNRNSVYTATFQAPPEQVRTLDVVVPLVGTFTGIEVTR